MRSMSLGKLPRLLSVLATTSLLLAGCAGSGPPQPPFVDAFTNLYNESSAGVPADVPMTLGQPIGIIFSDNVETYFQWVKASNAYWGNIVPTALTNTAELADNDPNYVSGRFLTMLKKHFPNSEVVHDFREAVAKRKVAVCLLDIRPLVGIGSFSTTKVDAIAYLFDSRMNPKSALSGHGEAKIPYPATTTRIQESTDGAIQQLDAKLSALVQ